MNKLFNKFLVGTLVGTMVLSTAAFAEDTTVDSSETETGAVESTVSSNRGKGFSHLFSRQTCDTENMEQKEQRGQMNQRGDNFENAVENGILTQDEADAILAFRDDQRADFQEATANMTIEEKHAYMEENHPEGSNLELLISEGLLTQDQADALEASAPEKTERIERTQRGNSQRTRQTEQIESDL